LLSRAWRADADAHLLLLVPCFDDDRHAGGVVDPVAAGIGEPSAAAFVWAFSDVDAVAGRGWCSAPPDAEPASELGRNDELELRSRFDDQTSLGE